MQRSCDRCKGDGRGVANDHMTVGGRGGGAGGRGRSLAGAGGKRRKGGEEEERGGGGGGERRKGRGGPEGPPLWACLARHSGPVWPFTLGQSGQSFWAHPAHHPWARPARQASSV